jgi:hypothetical protein
MNRRLEHHELEELKASLDCREVADHLGVHITTRPQGADWHARCFMPDHEDKHASLTLHKVGGWTCAGCGTSDVLKMIEVVRGKGFKDALDVALGLSTWRPSDYSGPTIKLPPRPKRKAPRLNLLEPPATPMQWPELMEPNLAGVALRTFGDFLANEPHTPGGAFDAWCASRGLCPVSLWAAGVRHVQDTTRLQPWCNTTKASLQAAGFVRDEKVWAGLWGECALFPVWHPSCPGYPITWRARFFNPKTKNKALAMYAHNESKGVATLPIGLLPHLATGTHLFLCEGETDYGALVCALPELKHMFGGHVHIVALCNMGAAASHPMLAALARMIEQARCVVVCADRGKAVKGTGVKGRPPLHAGEAVLKRVFGCALADFKARHDTDQARVFARIKTVHFIQDDKHDINDLWRDGELYTALDHALTAHIQDNPEWKNQNPTHPASQPPIASLAAM